MYMHKISIQTIEKFEKTFYFPLGAAQKTRDLDVSLVGEQAREAEHTLGELMPFLRKTEGPQREALLGFVRQALDTVQRAEKELEPAFFLACRHQEQQAQVEAQHRTFLSGFRDRLRYVGTDTVPRHWSLWGW